MNEDLSAIAGRLREAREMAGLSQGQVARLLSIHRPTVSEIEAGRRRVTAGELANLAKLYGVSLEWLAGQDQDNDAARKIRLAARELSGLRDDDLQKVLKLARSFHQRAD